MNRRKPALKLGPRAINRNTPDKETSKNEARAGIGLGLLGSYGDDSDDGIPVEDDYSDEEVKLPESTLDSKVADFLKEIDDLGGVIPAAKPKKQEKPPTKTEVEKIKDTAETDFKISWGSWQQCIDENTQHPYYWNTETNEVTWVVPEEIAKQYDSNVASIPNNEVKMQELTAELQKKEEPSYNNVPEDSIANRTSVYPWEENEQKNDFDIDAELDNALQCKEKSRSRKHDVPTGENDEIPLKRKKFHPLDVSEATQPSKHESKTDDDDDEEVDLEAKTELWQQWEDELSNKEEMSKSNQESEDSHGLKEASKNYDSEEKEESEDEDLSKYDMMAMDESASSDHQKYLSNDEDDAAEPRREDGKSPSVAQKTEGTIEEYIKEKVEIEEDLCTTLSKLECLKVTREAIPVLHILEIEVETRMADWKAGELSDSYVRAKLEESLQKLKQYENGLIPTGWTCHWDSRFKRYYFTDKWGTTQWDFPTEVETEETKFAAVEPAKSDPPIPQTAQTTVEKDIPEETKPEIRKTSDISKSDVTSSKDITDKLTPAAEDNTVNTSLDDKNDKASLKTDDLALSSDNKESTGHPGAPPYPGASGGMVDYGSYNMQNYYWNMQNYGMQYGSYDRSSTASGCDETFRNSPMHDQPPPPPGEDVAPLPPSVEQPPPPPLPPGEEELIPPPPPLPEETHEDNDDGIEMEISDSEEENVIGGFQPIGAEVKKPLVDYSALPPPPPPPTVVLTAAPVLSSAPVLKPVELPKPSPATQQPTAHAAKLKKTKKMKKEKTVVKKPPKQMFGMVAKWQKAKQDIEDEEQRLIMESEMELDRETDVNHRIQQWKTEQLQSGKAAMNANFQPVSDDWKKRVKQRKNKIT